jgi:hypothetical protein
MRESRRFAVRVTRRKLLRPGHILTRIGRIPAPDLEELSFFEYSPPTTIVD